MNHKRVVTSLVMLCLVTAVVIVTLGVARALPAASLPTLLQPYRVKDINPSGSSLPQWLTARAEGIYFAAEADAKAGLWRSDSLEPGTILVRSFGSTEIEYPFAATPWVMAGERLYFITWVPRDLWRSDGTKAGTVKLGDSDECEDPYLVTAVGEHVFVFAEAEGSWLCHVDQRERSREIKKLEPHRVNDAMAGATRLFFRTTEGKIGFSDGTRDGTILLEAPIAASGPDDWMVTVGDMLYFNGCTAAGTDCELWSLDGLTGTVARVADIEPGTVGSNPYGLVVMNSLLYFTAETTASGRQLWQSDGTALGTLPVATVSMCREPVSGRLSAAVVVDRLYFSGLDPLPVADPNHTGCELWVTDGTAVGTTLVLDILTGPESSFPQQLTAAPAELLTFFTACDGIHGRELWMSNGSLPGTTMVANIKPETGDPHPDCGYGACPNWLTYSDRKLYFTAVDELNDVELWALWSSYEPAVADFSVAPAGGPYPLEVTFQNLSTGEFDTCVWEFGDGSAPVTSCADQVHTYTAVGTYTVSLTVSGLGGADSKAVVDAVAVYAPAVANFAHAPASGLLPLEVSFTNLSTGAFDACTWRFGDGSAPVTSCADQLHTYTTPGFYSVSLTVSGLGGTNTKTVEDAVAAYPPLKAGFSADPVSGPYPLAVAFENLTVGNMTTCAWDFGDGTRVTSCADQVHTYVSAGTFTVSLAVTGPWEQDTKTVQDMITVYTPAVAHCTAVPHAGIAPLAVAFTNLATGDFDTCKWDFGDGEKVTSCANQTHIYADPGKYTIKFKVEGLGGEDTEVVKDAITVYEPVVANFSATPTSGPAPLKVRFENLSTGDFDTCRWTFGDGEKSTSCDDRSHTYDEPGAYTVSLEVSGPGGGYTKTITNYITVYAPVDADFSGAPTSGPAPLTVVFENESTGDYSTCIWDFGDGVQVTSCSNQTHTYVSAGAYTVKLTASGPGGEDSKRRKDWITVYAPAVADFAVSPAFGPYPLEVTFTNLSTGSFDSCTWEFGDGATAVGCADQTHTYTEAGVYTVSLTVTGPGGTDNKTVSEAVSAHVPVTAGFSATPLTGAPARLVTFENQSTGDFEQCLWEFGDGTSATACQGVTHLYTAEGSFTVTLTVSGPGGQDSLVRENYINLVYFRTFVPVISSGL